MLNKGLIWASPSPPSPPPAPMSICRGIESFQGFLAGAGFRPSTVDSSVEYDPRQFENHQKPVVSPVESLTSGEI